MLQFPYPYAMYCQMEPAGLSARLKAVMCDRGRSANLAQRNLWKLREVQLANSQQITNVFKRVLAPF